MGYGTSEEGNKLNPIVEVNLRAKQKDNFYFKNNPEEQYVGLYHRHEDGTLMIGRGILGVDHELIPDEIIFKKINYQNLQDTREKVSDIFYKIWFESNTLSDTELLSLQTTIRDGKKQSGRTEDEPLVFYKKDRNTLENRKDLTGNTFEQLCEYIFNEEIIDLENYFNLILENRPPENENSVVQYVMKFKHGDIVFDTNVARKVGENFEDILNLSQLTKPKFGNKIDPEKAREILDTDIFELLPTQTTRQDQIDNFFSDFDNLIGPPPDFIDTDGDGVSEYAENYEEDEQSRISYEDQINAYITRLNTQSNSNNEGQTLEDMRNRLSSYLEDVDYIVDEVQDNRPEYVNVSSGFLKIRKPNQAIIIKSSGNNLLEFQKEVIKEDGSTGPSYLVQGFTITMWVRFVSKTSQGTLFNFGNSLEENGKGFRLETRTNVDSVDNYKRWIRLAVREEDGTLRDNHWGVEGRARRIDDESSPIGFYSDTVIHQLYPNISTDDLNEWYFICATYNPNISEVGSNQRFDKQYWLNHVKDDGEIVANSGLGAKCKVEIISRSDLLRARGYKIGDLAVSSPDVDTVEDVPIIEEDIPPIIEEDIPPTRDQFDIEIEYEESEETDIDTDVGY